MKNIEIVCLGVNLSAFFSFNLLFNYWQVFDGNELFLAQAVAAVTSSLSSSPPVSEPTLAPAGWYISEYVGIMIFMAVSAIVPMITLVVATVKRVKYGKYRFFIPLVFSSVGVVTCVIYTSVKYGVYPNA
ncbi:MAG: hypothetical protein K6L81_12995 [Agarilytica sp.]